MKQIKGQKIFNKALLKLMIAYALFTGIIAVAIFFFLFIQIQKNTPKPPPPPDRATLPSLSPTPDTQSKFCGGIAGIACPTGFSCKLSGDYPDAGGQCVKDESADEQTFCTMDAKQCPDGSFVGRSGPKCEFAPCPTQ